MNCFFCCKILPKEESCRQNDELEDSFKESSTGKCDSDYIKVNENTNQKSILQISHYLHIPNKIEIEKGTGSFEDVISCCEDCQEISEKLGDLCGLLEITQMKINYYLNLLTDQILKKEDYLEHQQIHLSKFQETFHKKCLTKLAKIEPNPVLQLTKCIPCPVEDIDVTPTYLQKEKPANYDNDIVDDEYKPVSVQNIRPIYHFEKFPCDICPLRFNSLTNKNRHINSSHMGQKTSHGHLIKACEFCGAMLSTKSLSTHKRRMHGFGTNKVELEKKYNRCDGCGHVIRDKNMKRHLMKCVNRFKTPGIKYTSHKQRGPVKCEFCEKLISYQNISIHKRRVHGIVAEMKDKLPELKECEFCGTRVASEYLGTHQRVRCKGRLNKKGKGEEKVEENSLVKCCEFCGEGVLRDKIVEHEELWCEVKKRMRELGECGGMEREENLKCGGCGKIFEFGRDLREHLRGSKGCGGGFGQIDVVND